MGSIRARLTPGRLIAGFAFEVASAAVVVGVPGAWLLRHMDLAPLAAAQATGSLGRKVAVDSLRVEFGRTLGIELSGVTIANIEGASAPATATLKHLSARLDTRSLLHGPTLVHSMSIDGLHVWLERTADRTPNWRFGPPHEGSDPSGLSSFPSLRSVQVRDSDVSFRTTSGKQLVSRFDSAAIETTADDQPVKLTIAGAYNDIPITLDADLQPLAALRAVPKPYRTDLHFATGEVRLRFDGTMTDPLAVDGAVGTLELDAPDPAPIYAIAGLSGGPDASLFLTGGFEHNGPLWQLSDAHGSLQTSEVVKATLSFQDAVHGKPDHIGLDLAFDALDINDIVGAGPRGKRSGADMSLAVERSPDTLVKAHIAAKALDYSSVKAANVVLDAALEPGRIAVDELSLNTFGTRVRAAGRIEAAAAGGRITADVQASGADVQQLRREFGVGSLPVTGRLDMQVTADATARTLNAAWFAARISGVGALRGGSVEKSVIEMASTDVRALFRTNHGSTPVTCLILGVDMRGGVGTVAPLRIRAAEGTIAGSATFDLNRHTIDLTIGSEARSTGLFALDIPVRVSGPLASPIISPAQWTPQGRAMLAAADNLGRLPPALQAFARRYPCPR